MAEGIRLEITVDDKGTPVVRQFAAEVGKIPGTTDTAADSTSKLAAQTTGLSSTLVNATTK